MYSGEAFEVLYDDPAVTGRPVKVGDVGMQRTKTITSGPIVEVVSFPLWSTKTEASKAKKLMEIEKQREAQKKLNHKHSMIKMDRLINGNFGKDDLLCTFSFPAGMQPETDKAAKRYMENYLRRVKTMRKRLKLTEPFKYVYIIERTESAKYGTRYHYHIIMSGKGMDRDEVEALWHNYTGGNANTRRYQRQAAHLTGWSRYMTKFKAAQVKATRRGWCASKNLIDPAKKATVSDSKVSRRQARRMAEEGEASAVAMLLKKFPEHEMLEIEVKTSPFVQGVYVYAKMRKPETHTFRQARWTG